jgi:hypothetical protein
MNKPSDYRQHPHLYRPEGDPFDIEPYASEIAPHLDYATMEAAAESAARLYALYERYKGARDFVGMDMVARFLRLGRIRAEQGIVPGDASRPSPAAIFSKTYRMVKNDPEYVSMREERFGVDNE